MNNILEEVEELKELIIDTKEYKDYKKNLDLLENNKEINDLIKKITTKQKEVVRNNTNSKELDDLYEELNNIELYKNYIESSKKLNILITNIQNNFQEYFDSLVS